MGLCQCRTSEVSVPEAPGADAAGRNISPGTPDEWEAAGRKGLARKVETKFFPSALPSLGLQHTWALSGCCSDSGEREAFGLALALSVSALFVAPSTTDLQVMTPRGVSLSRHSLHSGPGEKLDEDWSAKEGRRASQPYSASDLWVSRQHKVLSTAGIEQQGAVPVLPGLPSGKCCPSELVTGSAFCAYSHQSLLLPSPTPPYLLLLPTYLTGAHAAPDRSTPQQSLPSSHTPCTSLLKLKENPWSSPSVPDFLAALRDR